MATSPAAKAVAIPLRTRLMRRSVATEPDTHRDRNELGVRAFREHVMKASLDEQACAAGLEVEACARVDTEVGLASREHVTRVVRAGQLRVVESAATDDEAILQPVEAREGFVV